MIESSGNISRCNLRENKYLEIAEYSILGTRSYQQDYASVMVDGSCVVVVLCDGMGGLNGGERASSLASKKLIEDFMHRDQSVEINDFLKREAELIDRRVANLKDETGRALGAGTTLVAAVVIKDLFYWISVGDSKIYLLKGGILKSINREHNYRLILSESLKNGKINRQTYDAEEKTKRADALVSFIGMGGLQLVDGSRFPINLETDDIILLCSDGVTKSLSDIQIQSIINDNAFNPRIAAERLVDMSLEYSKGGQDNTTAVILTYKNPGLEEFNK